MCDRFGRPVVTSAFTVFAGPRLMVLGTTIELSVDEKLPVMPKPSSHGVSMLKGIDAASSRPRMLPPLRLTGWVKVPSAPPPQPPLAPVGMATPTAAAIWVKSYPHALVYCAM